MGHDHQQSSSSGAVAAIVVAVLLVGIIGLLAVAGAGLFWMKTAREQSQAVTQSHTVTQSQAVASEPPDPRLTFEVTLDREGNASIDGEEIGLDALKAQLVKLKDETSDAFSVQINVDTKCPVKHVISVADMLKAVGGIDYQIKSSGGADSPAEGNDANAN